MLSLGPGTLQEYRTICGLSSFRGTQYFSNATNMFELPRAPSVMVPNMAGGV